MAVNLKQLTDGSMGLEGSELTAGEFVVESASWVPTSVDVPLFVASRKYRVKNISARVEVAGTDAGAVTAVVRKAASGTAIASGTALHSGTINIKGTAATIQELTLSTTDTDLDIADGDMIGIDFTGVLTAATGCVTVALTPK
jgi:hypothetical protein